MWLSLAAPIVICAILSASIEMTQLFTPSRDTSALDLLTNITGSMVGVLIAAVFEDAFVKYGMQWGRRGQVLDRAALCLLICWITALVFPFFPLVGHTPISRKLIIFLHSPVASPIPFLSAMVTWLVVGSLLQAAGFRSPRMLTAISVLLIPSQLFIVDRQPLPSEFAGAIAGVLVLTIFWPKQGVFLRAQWKILAAVFLAAIVLRGLSPYVFSQAALPFSWIPFSGFLNTTWQTGIQQIVQKFFWYGTAIWLLRKAGARAMGATVAVAVVLLFIEIAQTHLPGHVAEITDPLWALFASVALLVIERDSGH